MKFLVCQKQHGEGCDYTIGCGMTYSIHNAVDREQLIEDILYPEGRGHEDEYCVMEGDEALQELIIIPVDDDSLEYVDLEKIVIDMMKDKKDKDKQDLEDKEREEFERLKKKFDR